MRTIESLARHIEAALRFKELFIKNLYLYLCKWNLKLACTLNKILIITGKNNIS
jgi:hypothetical protein